MRGSRRIVWLAAAAGLLCAPGIVDAQGRAPELPPGEGREVAQAACTVCHGAVTVMLKRDGENGWRATAERMVVQKGAQIAPADMETVVRYLSTALGPGAGKMQTPGPLPPGAVGGSAKSVAEVRLPDGEGKTLVETRCTACHDLGRIVSYGRPRAEWDQITRNMMGRFPQPASAQDIAAIVTYLTTHFREE
jgi:cytochrome c5